MVDQKFAMLFGATMILGSCAARPAAHPEPGAPGFAPQPDPSALAARADADANMLRARCEPVTLPLSREASEPEEAVGDDDALTRASSLLGQATACRDVLSYDEYRSVLLTVRALLGAWYAGLPRQRARALSSEPSGLRLEDGALQRMGARRSLADDYLLTETEIERISEAAGRSRSVIDADLGRGQLLWSMMRVDATTGVLLAGLVGTAPGARPSADDALDPIARRFGRALVEEGEAWAREQVSTAGVAAAVFKPRSNPLSLTDRLDLVSRYVKMVGTAWGSRPSEALRANLGRPFHAYLSALLEAEAKRQPGKAGMNGPRIPWIVEVETASQDESRPVFTSDLTLARMLGEIAFDDENTRAYFALREVESVWRALLDRRGVVEGSDDQLVSASHRLIEALALVDRRADRLRAVARLVVTTDLLDGRRADTGGELPTDAKGKARAEAVQAFRKRATRQLAEVALCGLNHALFEPAGGTDCAVSLDPRTPPPSAVSPVCSAGVIAQSLIAGPPKRTAFPDPAPRAYETVIAALDLQWATQATEPKIADATRCELSRVLDGALLGRLPVDLSTMNHGVEMIASRRVRVPPPQLGSLLSQAIQTANEEQRASCESAGVIRCSAAAFREALKGAKDGDRSRGEAFRSRYCAASQVGGHVFEIADRAGLDGSAGLSLVVLARPYLDPPEASFRSRGLSLLAEGRACVDEPPVKNGVNP